MSVLWIAQSHTPFSHRLESVESSIMAEKIRHAVANALSTQVILHDALGRHLLPSHVLPGYNYFFLGGQITVICS